MIDIAVIASIPHLDHLSSAGTIDMALTHLVLAQPTYAAYFRARALGGVTVILDNSAYELQDTIGAGMTAAPVLRAAERTGAAIVICQDVLFDGPATLTATRHFLDAARHHPFPSGTGPRFMGVPQGRTRAEWLHCYDQLARMPGIDLIGLSKLSVPRCFDAPVAESRIACVTHLLDHDQAPKPLHLLGGDRSLPWELSQHRRLGHDRVEHGGVRSNDSSFAFWYAANDIPVHPHSRRADCDAATRPDLVTGRLTPARLTTALAHVALLRHSAGLPAMHTAPRGSVFADQESSPCP